MEQDGVRLHFVERGSGPPVVLLHGNGEDGTYFANQMEDISRSYRTIAVDTRGHGQSPRGTMPFTIRQFAVDLRAFLDEQGIDRAHIVGFSDGANVALVFALRFPERVGALVLNGGNLDAHGIKASVQIPIEVGYRIARAFSRVGAKAKRHEELLGLMVNDPNIEAAELADLRMPVLVVCGSDDMVKDEHSRLIADSIPGAKLSVLEGDHFVAAKRPEVFNPVVLAFLREANAVF